MICFSFFFLFFNIFLHDYGDDCFITVCKCMIIDKVIKDDNDVNEEIIPIRSVRIYFL